MLYVLWPLAAYAAGSTPFGVIIAAARGIDLRAHGSGNVGATNVARVLGRRWGILCFALDVAKGLLPVLAAGVLLRRGGLATAEQFAWLAVALGAILGHIFSFWLRFRGGKGVATSLGVLLGFWPYFTLPGLAAFALWIVVTGLSGYVSLGSIAAAAAFPVFFVASCLLAARPLAEVLPLLVFAVAMAGLVILRHRTNIGRLLRGQENRIGRKKGRG
ncbi:MAG: glycerol-3-phosphate 1-O-acyltransferase PlsY [Planctomycetes bacterium]|nr:glycerol-3-phosphate 1-O-acyltransferase PlsY [Planctomycetota bacterium]